MNRKVAVMQPYWLPYIGYFQLIHLVDVFVIYNDVQFIERGWINRNKFLMNNEIKTMTIPLKGASSSKNINEIEVDFTNRNFHKLVRSISQAYSKAPYFSEVISIFNKGMSNNVGETIDEFCLRNLRLISEYLEMETQFVLSSDLQYDHSEGRADKLIEICGLTDSKTLVFPPGSRLLYTEEEFPGIETYSIQAIFRPYNQMQKLFVEGLSFLDVLMFNSKEEVRFHLDQFNRISLNGSNI